MLSELWCCWPALPNKRIPPRRLLSPCAARRYAHKVLQALVRARLVRSQPGPGGGYSLVRPPEDVSILDVLAAVEPIPRIRRCPLGLKSHTSFCPLHRELDEAAAATERPFVHVTIAQLLNQPGSVPPLCELR